MLYYALAKSDKVCQTVKPSVSAKTNNVVNFHPRYDQLVAKECLLRATFIRFSYYTYIFSTHTTPTPLLKLIGVNRKAVTCKLTELNHTAPITQQCMVQHQPTPVTSAENKCRAGGGETHRCTTRWQVCTTSGTHWLTPVAPCSGQRSSCRKRRMW